MSQGRASQGDCARRGRRLLVTAQAQAGGDNVDGCLVSGAHPEYGRLPQLGRSLGPVRRGCARARDVEVGP